MVLSTYGAQQFGDGYIYPADAPSNLMVDLPDLTIMTQQSQPLSPKRERLQETLRVILTRIETLSLPLHITEVYAFGSYSRMKENPKGIDLMVFYAHHSEYDVAFETLRDVIEKEQPHLGNEDA